MSEQKEWLCPRGHRSTEADYCSECGARIGANVTPRVPSHEVVAGGERCPDCGTLREQAEVGFCEVCGFNFRTGAHGEIGIMPAETPAWAGEDHGLEVPSDAAGQLNLEPRPDPHPDPDPDLEPRPDTSTALPGLRLVVSVQAVRSESGVQGSAEATLFAVELARGAHLLGRFDSACTPAPEIAIRGDDAVSRRHAVIEPASAGGGWVVRDLGSANGTRLSGQALEPGREYALQPGDELTLGHGTCLRVEAL